MRQIRLLVLLMAVASLTAVVVAVYAPTEPSTTFQDDTATFAPGFCGNFPDLTPRCWGNSGTFVYELSDGTLTVVPHEMPMNEAVQTYNAYVIANNTPAPYEPTPQPDGTVATGGAAVYIQHRAGSLRSADILAAL